MAVLVPGPNKVVERRLAPTAVPAPVSVVARMTSVQGGNRPQVVTSAPVARGEARVHVAPLQAAVVAGGVPAVSRLPPRSLTPPRVARNPPGQPMTVISPAAAAANASAAPPAVSNVRVAGGVVTSSIASAQAARTLAPVRAQSLEAPVVPVVRSRSLEPPIQMPIEGPRIVERAGVATPPHRVQALQALPVGGTSMPVTVGDRVHAVVDRPSAEPGPVSSGAEASPYAAVAEGKLAAWEELEPTTLMVCGQESPESHLAPTVRVLPSRDPRPQLETREADAPAFATGVWPPDPSPPFRRDLRRPSPLRSSSAVRSKSAAGDAPASQRRPVAPVYAEPPNLLVDSSARSRSPIAREDLARQHSASPRQLALDPSQLAPTRPASPVLLPTASPNWIAQAPALPPPISPRALSGVLSPGRHDDNGERDYQASLAPTPAEQLKQEVAAREVEIRVLRAEVEAKEHEAVQLKENLRTVELSLLEASGTIDTVSKQAETKAENRHALLEASARNMDQQVQALRRKLADKEWQVADKDEEVEKLRGAVRENQVLIDRQNGERSILRKSNDEQGIQVAQLAEDASRLEREKAMGEWQKRAAAKLQQESANVASQQQRQAYVEQMQRLDEEMVTCKAFIERMEGQCRRHVAELERQQRRCDELHMEERLCDKAAEHGGVIAQEHMQTQLVEGRELEGKIQEEVARKHARATSLRAYEAHAADALTNQAQLMALTACMGEMARALHAGPGGPDDAVDAAMSAFLHAARGLGQQMPPVIRVGPSDYLLGNDLVQCALVDGRLMVRLPGGGLTGIGDFVQSRQRAGVGVHGVPPSPQAPALFQPAAPSRGRSATPPRVLVSSPPFAQERGRPTNPPQASVSSSPIALARSRSTTPPQAPGWSPPVAPVRSRSTTPSRSAMPPGVQQMPPAAVGAVAATSPPPRAASWGVPALVAPIPFGGGTGPFA